MIIPNFDRTIIRTRQNIRLITGWIVVNAVNTTFMPLQSIMRSMRAKAPNLDGTIQTGRRKGIAILGIKLDLHDIVRMSFEHLRAIKATIPIPQLDGHIVRRREHVRKRRVDFQGTNVICMSFKLLDFLHCVIVEDTKTHIVGGCDEPLLSRDEFGASDRQF